MNFFKRFVLPIFLATIVCVCASLSFFRIDQTPALMTMSEYKTVKTIIIDAGHGGFDGGAVAEDGTPEKNINLQIAMNLRDLLEFYNFEVVMTREEDKSTASDDKLGNKKASDLQNRLALMKKYDNAIFVSIHLNKFTSTGVSGAQTFYSQNAENSEQLAQSVHGMIINMLQPENTREIKKGNNNIYILKNATCPAIIVECGFLSNKAELEKLKDENYQRMMAFCIFCGIMNYSNRLR